MFTTYTFIFVLLSLFFPFAFQGFRCQNITLLFLLVALSVKKECVKCLLFLLLIPQDLQDEVKRESNNLQKLLAQKEEAEEILNGLDEEKAKLEEQLSSIRQKCAEEADLVGFGSSFMVEKLGPTALLSKSCTYLMCADE